MSMTKLGSEFETYNTTKNKEKKLIIALADVVSHLVYIRPPWKIWHDHREHMQLDSYIVVMIYEMFLNFSICFLSVNCYTTC